MIRKSTKNFFSVTFELRLLDIDFIICTRFLTSGLLKSLHSF